MIIAVIAVLAFILLAIVLIGALSAEEKKVQNIFAEELGPIRNTEKEA